jgi:5'-nucleotidase
MPTVVVALVLALVPAVSAQTCGDVKAIYKSNACCGGASSKSVSSPLLASAVPTCSLMMPGKATDLTILHMNDHHSHLTDETFTIRNTDIDIEYAVANPLTVTTDEMRGRYGGYPRIVSLLKHLEASSGDVLKLHAGDAITGTTFYSLFKGAADAQMMGHACFDAFALGNHEFDDGDAGLARFIGALHEQDALCPDLAVLGANVVPGPSSPLKTLPPASMIKPSMIKTLPSGEKVGVVGIDIRNKTMQSSSPDAGTILLDEKAAAQAAITALTCAGINKIVLLTHIGYTNDMEWMAGLTGVDVVVGGDSHTLLDSSGGLPGTPSGPYPTMVGNVCVVQAWEYAHGVGDLKVSFDADGVVTGCTGSMKYPFDASSFQVRDASPRFFLNEGDAAVVATYLSSLGKFVSVAADSATEVALAGFSAQVDTLKQTVIATVPSSICFERIPGQGRSSICTPEQTASQGGGACNVVAKAFMTVTKSADISIQNAGGCRTDIAAGDWTIDDSYTMLPFSNTLVTLQMTGAEIVTVLGQAVQYAYSGSSGAYPYASGLRYAVDGTAATAVSAVEVNSRLTREWSPIDTTKVYTVATNNYIAGGKDGYLAFAAVSGAKYTDTYTEYAQGFIDYVTDLPDGLLLDVPLSEYSTTSYTPPSP